MSIVAGILVLYMASTNVPALLAKATTPKPLTYDAASTPDIFAYTNSGWLNMASTVGLVVSIVAIITLAIAVWPLYRREAIGWRLTVLYVACQTVTVVIGSLSLLSLFVQLVTDQTVTGGLG